MPKPPWHECVALMEMKYDAGVGLYVLTLIEQDPRTNARLPPPGPAMVEIVAAARKALGDDSVVLFRDPRTWMIGIGSKNQAAIGAIYDWWNLPGLREMDFQEYLRAVKKGIEAA